MNRNSAGKVSNSNSLRVVAGLTLLAILVFSVDGEILISHLSNLRSDYLAYAVLCIVAATLIGSYNAYLVVALDSTVAYWRFLGFYWFSWALGLVVPGQVGDVASLTYLMKRAGLEWPKIMARAVLDKFISFVVMGLLAGFALVRYSAKVRLEDNTMVWIVAVAILMAVAGYLLLRKLWSISTGKVSWVDKLRSAIRDLVGFIQDKPVLVGINFVGTTLKIALIGCAYWFVFLSGGAEDPGWVDVVLLVTVSSLVAYIPISFNGLGTVEITGILLFSIIGLGEELVLSSYLVLRVTVLVIAWTPALLILVFSRKATD